MESPPPLIDRLDALEESRFSIERELGRGGTASVYLAHDRILDRSIALKVLHPSVAAAIGTDRFAREVKETARLVHPNIVPLFDSGAIGGLHFYVMPFVEGETLRQRLDREGRLPLDRALAIARDVIEALAYAHAQGVVHRDVKPENVFCYQDRALVADFGIAKVMDRPEADTLTRVGTMVGTAAYVSPEQAGGDPVDGRSDLYSLGCVLFEMIAGRPPFQGANAYALIARHLVETPPRLERDDLPAGLADLVARLLAKDPADRPPSAVVLLDELKSQGGRPTIRVPRPTKGLAVLPLVNLSADPENEYFSDGLTEDLITKLHNGLGLEVTPRSAVFGLKHRNVSAVQAAAALRVSHVVEGTVRRAGNRIRVTAQLVSAAGTTVWAERFDGTVDDLFGLQDAITDGIVQALRPLTPVPKTVKKPPTRDPEVHDLIMRSKAIWRRAIPGGAGARERLELAQSLAEQAVGLAPEDPGAIEMVAMCLSVAAVRGYAPFEPTNRRANEMFTEVLRRDPNRPLSLVSLGVQALYLRDDFPLAAELLSRAVTLDVSEPESFRFHGVIQKILGRHDEAVAAHRKAVELDPNAAVLFYGLGDVLIAAGHHDEAIDALRMAIRLEPHYDAALERLELACYRSGRLDEAFDARRARLMFRQATERASMLETTTEERGYPEARRQDLEIELSGQLARASQEDPFATAGTSRMLADDIVVTLSELGRWNEAMDWIERGYHRRPGRLRRTLTDFPFDRRGLAIDPRYARLLRTAGLEELL
jgi:serine/threonine-protein kinase